MKIVIVGAGGLVGAGFARSLPLSHDVVALRHDQLDVTDDEAVNSVIAKTRPDLVINCAVVGVDACETNPQKAHAVNVFGAENVARAANAVGAELVQFSSNYVFDGSRAHPHSYTVDDQPNPLNVYGKTKLAGERSASITCERCFIVRTSWVFGPGKLSFFATLPSALRARKIVRAIHDVWASPTYVNDLVNRVMEVVSGHRYGTYHVVNSGVCSYYDFALETAQTIGFSLALAAKLIEPVDVKDMNFCAARPRYTPMSCKVSAELGLPPLRDWHAALADYVQFKT
jgi:dTDP-4-dehydrorhamnose reductase